MEKLPAAFIPEKGQGVNTIIHFQFSGEEEGEWNMAITDGRVVIDEGAPVEPPKMTLKADSDDFVKLFTGELDGMQAFMQGKIKLSGDLNLAMKLLPMFKLT